MTMRYLMLISLIVFFVGMVGCSDEEGPIIPPPPVERLGPATVQELMVSFVDAYENLDYDLYMSLLHPDFEMILQKETQDQFPSLGSTLDYSEEQRICERMFSGDDLTNPDTGAFIPGIQAMSFGKFEALDTWKVAKTDTTNPEALTCPYDVDIIFNRGQDQTQIHVDGVIRFNAVRIDSTVGGEVQTYYQMSGQVDLTQGYKGTESSTWGGTKALYR
jgi:hypothetical protein